MLNKLADYNGYIPVSDRPLSKVGVFPYLGSSIGADDPKKIYMVYRPAEELSNDETINSFKLVPLIDEHTQLGKDGIPAEKKGVHGVTGENVYFKDGILYGNMKVFSESMKNLIEGGKKQLSLGYKSVYVFENGVFEGQKYDAIQTKLRGNHIALVDEGRMGKEVSVIDEALKTIVTMDAKDLILKEENKQMTEEQFKALLEAIGALNTKLDGLVKMEQSEATDEEEKSEDESEEEKTGDEQSENEELKKQVADMEEKIKATGDVNDIKKALMKEVAQKTRLAESLSKHIGTFDHLDMDLQGVVEYGLKKLELTADKGHELATLNGYLAGARVSVATGDTKEKIVHSTSLDVFDR